MKKKRKIKKNESKKIQQHILPEYYIVTFIHTHKHHLLDTREICRKARVDLISDYQKKLKSESPCILEGDEAWDSLNPLLAIIESKIKKIIEQHSLFYWFHLYRRMAPGSIADENEKSDSGTTASVRLTLETAFFKYAKNTGDDICLSNSISAKEVLGGFFYDAHLIGGVNERIIEKIWEFHQNKPQWVLRDYSPSTHESIYILESYAYEYWRVTAKLRAIGKGVPLLIETNGKWSELRSIEQEELINSYDRRLMKGSHYLSTAKGLPSFTDNDENHFQSYIFCLRYNYDKISFGEFIRNNNPFGRETSNFIPLILNFNNFIISHKSLSIPFFNKKGFSLKSLMLFLQAISYLHITHRTESPEGKKYDVVKLWSMMQRAYTTINIPLKELCTELYRILTLIPQENDTDAKVDLEELLLICEHYTLRDSQKEIMSLWSRGPRPIMFTHEENLVIDLGGIQTILENVFFSIRENNQERGNDFEDIIREEIKRRGYNLLQVRNFRRSDGKFRETDLAIRSGNTLILCDCLSSERPLDWIIGKPSVIKKRTVLLRQKIEKVLSIKKFVSENLNSINGDYSWVENIISLGIVTDVEWIDSSEDIYWIDKERDLPILMSIQEFTDFLEVMKE
ncbi:hypothetical protein HN028_11040 [Pantoea ananatis]|uniref:hypothetical protein n=1 Tax=Pantoea ananas TaxID=553 RepID=UPI002236204C|nr:hypothetical protein [Pantoea ananatis]BBL29237.1 hypothetical protein PAFU01_06850 [Pantoea ananatis]